jgi:hypothetical protein
VALRKALSFSRVTRFTSIDEFLEALDSTEDVPEPELIVAEPEFEVEPRGLPWSFIVVVIIALVAIALVSQDRLLRQLGISDLQFPGTTQVAAPDIPDATVPEQSTVAVATEAITEAVTRPERPPAQIVRPAPPPAETVSKSLGSYEPMDFASLPPADLVLDMVEPGTPMIASELVLRENGADATVDLVRSHNLHEALSVRLLQKYSTGNRSPMESRQFRMDRDGVVQFQPGQKRARTTIEMTSDPLREPDQQVNLVVSKVGDDTATYASLNLNLEDDDQRTFELSLEPNTVAFAVSQVSVREEEPAVQIDVLRFRPDNTRLDVEYSVRDITATQGKDYFAEATNTVSFEPGQRNARILIPLVQDTMPESDEAFALELLTVNPSGDRDVFLRIAVMIRDDDS